MANATFHILAIPCLRSSEPFFRFHPQPPRDCFKDCSSLERGISTKLTIAATAVLVRTVLLRLLCGVELHDLVLGGIGHAVFLGLLDAVEPPVDFVGVETELRWGSHSQFRPSSRLGVGRIEG